MAGNKEFKISFKQENADFLENKTNKERAEQLLGSDWKNIISNATQRLKKEFESRPLIYKTSSGKTEAGAITLGWKFELLNVSSGQLSGDMMLSHDQVVDVYAGTNLKGDKKDASVNGKVISNCGIANYILFEEQVPSTIQEAANLLVPIEKYANDNSNVYFACKALNYRTFHKKYDGNRPLAVYVNWSVENNKLSSALIFDTPLMQGGDYAFERLSASLKELGIKDTNDIDDNIVNNPKIIHE